MDFMKWWNKNVVNPIIRRFIPTQTRYAGGGGGGGYSGGRGGPARSTQSSGTSARAPQGSQGGGGLSAPQWSGGWSDGGGGGGGGGWGGGGGGWSDGGAAAAAAAAQAKANAEGKARSDRENAATRANVDHQLALLTGFAKSRGTKLGNIKTALDSSDKILIDGYKKSLGSLKGNILDNDKAQGDNSFANVANAIRERQDISNEVASQGGGETDVLRAALASLRNYTANQAETNRAFHDTLRSANNSITSLNTETLTSRNNLFNQAEADREAAHANYNNQMAETWTQISNIENANTNVDSDSSNAYIKSQPDAAKEAAKYTGASYKRAKAPANWSNWSGKGTTEERNLTSSNRAAAVNLGGPIQRPEGATLRKW